MINGKDLYKVKQVMAKLTILFLYKSWMQYNNDQNVHTYNEHETWVLTKLLNCTYMRDNA